MRPVTLHDTHLQFGFAFGIPSASATSTFETYGSLQSVATHRSALLTQDAASRRPLRPIATRSVLWLSSGLRFDSTHKILSKSNDRLCYSVASVAVCRFVCRLYGMLRCVLEQKLLLIAYRKYSEKYRLIPKWPWPLFRGRLKSCRPLRHIRHWISRKPLKIEAWFQRTTNRKWGHYRVSNGNVTDDVTWPRKVKLVTPICLEPNV